MNRWVNRWMNREMKGGEMRWPPDWRVQQLSAGVTVRSCKRVALSRRDAHQIHASLSHEFFAYSVTSGLTSGRDGEMIRLLVCSANLVCFGKIFFERVCKLFAEAPRKF